MACMLDASCAKFIERILCPDSSRMLFTYCFGSVYRTACPTSEGLHYSHFSIFPAMPQYTPNHVGQASQAYEPICHLVSLLLPCHAPFPIMQVTAALDTLPVLYTYCYSSLQKLHVAGAQSIGTRCAILITTADLSSFARGFACGVRRLPFRAGICTNSFGT
ncbi:hypothetical protein BAUCODRAFT_212463 [Baudoinia panamericana UAMH 10762]|uniref:Uncharacterized protein n=1 Tax=Baudoinia panamericana (strain UAMH 10762) TaxID=717646 RepID=M2MBG6_BAUPA|nr:uncharacterized protein BAUCODRAFT_212463 [Baudoinia panamericana UAMH 10762]EMC93851.1 hypothetical protein BAUCODRAFT_212463 [Baudoinia panamericana UAMH 10762]